MFETTSAILGEVTDVLRHEAEVIKSHVEFSNGLGVCFVGNDITKKLMQVSVTERLMFADRGFKGVQEYANARGTECTIVLRGGAMNSEDYDTAMATEANRRLMEDAEKVVE